MMKRLLLYVFRMGIVFGAADTAHAEDRQAGLIVPGLAVPTHRTCAEFERIYRPNKIVNGFHCDIDWENPESGADGCVFFPVDCFGVNKSYSELECALSPECIEPDGLPGIAPPPPAIRKDDKST